MAAKLNIQYKESILDGLLKSWSDFMKTASFFLPREYQMPLIDIAKRRTILGWEVIHISKLLFKMTKKVTDQWGNEYYATLRYYFCTHEYVVSFDDSKHEFEYQCGAAAKLKIRKWLNERSRI